MGAGVLHTQPPPSSSVLPCKGPHACVWTAACSSPPQPPQPHPPSILEESRGGGSPGCGRGRGRPHPRDLHALAAGYPSSRGHPCPVGGCGPKEAQSRVLWDERGSAARSRGGTRGGTVHRGEGPGTSWGPGGSRVQFRYVDLRSHVQSTCRVWWPLSIPRGVRAGKCWKVASARLESPHLVLGSQGRSQGSTRAVSSRRPQRGGEWASVHPPPLAALPCRPALASECPSQSSKGLKTRSKLHKDPGDRKRTMWRQAGREASAMPRER